MKLAVVGSRKIKEIFIDDYIPKEVTEIVSGGAKGVDTVARDFAKQNGLKLTEFIPEYNLYGRAAPIKRNEEIAKYADEVVAFWDGKSKGTLSTVKFFEKLGKKVRVVIFEAE